jgi:threonine dehydratase
LDAAFGKRIFIKAECLQVTGSFKFRGAWSAVSALPAGTRGVLAYSSGNHGQGVALAAARHGMTCVIVMPSDAPAVKIDNIRAYGAEVVLYDRATQDRDAQWLEREVGTLLIELNGTGTSKLEFTATAAQLENKQPGNRNDMITDDLTWLATKAANPDEELLIEFTPTS